MHSWVSPVPGWALKCLAQGHSYEKTQRIQCGSNPGPLDYESKNTLPPSHAGRFLHDKGWLVNWLNSIYTALNTVSVILLWQLTLFMSLLSFTSSKPGLSIVLPKDTPTENQEDPVQLEPRTPGLRVKHFTTEPCGIPTKDDPTSWFSRLWDRIFFHPQLGDVLLCIEHHWHILTISQTTNFRHFQTQGVCRCQFQIWWKWQKVLRIGWKLCGKKEKLLVTSNFSFSHSVFKRLVLQTRKNQGLFGKRIKPLLPERGSYTSINS